LNQHFDSKRKERYPQLGISKPQDTAVYMIYVGNKKYIYLPGERSLGLK